MISSQDIINEKGWQNRCVDKKENQAIVGSLRYLVKALVGAFFKGRKDGNKCCYTNKRQTP